MSTTSDSSVLWDVLRRVCRSRAVSRRYVRQFQRILYDLIRDTAPALSTTTAYEEKVMIPWVEIACIDGVFEVDLGS